MPLKRLVFIRSGETDWNLSGRWQGWVASPLNEHGRAQLQRLSNFVRHLGLSALYSSDNRRAVQSAEILADKLGFQPIYDERLRERSIGHFQGLTVPEIHGWYAEEYHALLRDPENFQIPEGESMAQVRERAQQAIRDIIKISDKEKDADVTVGVLSHTSTTHVMLKELIPDLDLSDIVFSNSSVTTVIREGDGWRLIQANDLSHLEGLESRYMPSDVQGDTK
jgi:broad specificity phosphatase PhoE